MAATCGILSVEEYLRTVTEPDSEYVSGVIEERAAGELDHASWQKALLRWFLGHEKDWGVRVYPELRVQVAADRFRVPDVTLLRQDAPREQVVTHVPAAVIEILSPEDAMSRTLEKLADYARMGIAAIWLIDPRQNLLWSYCDGALRREAEMVLDAQRTAPLAEIAALVD